MQSLLLQFLLDSWTAGSNRITYLSGGIAYSSKSGGGLRDTVNTAFLALLYGLGDASARRYSCWARHQIQHIVGDTFASERSYVVGFGITAPLQAAHRAASCADSVQPCSGLLATSDVYLATTANPHVLHGALVAGLTNGTYADARSSIDNTVSIEQNSAFTGALGVLSAGRLEWDVCLRRDALLDQTSHPFVRV